MGAGAGKTAVGCALISAMPGQTWAAVKVSPHLHQLGQVWVETNRGSEKDTGRYLRAGAQRAILVSAVDDEECVALVQDVLDLDIGSILVESNRMLGWTLEPQIGKAVRLAVLAGQAGDWKRSFWDTAEHCDGLVLTGGLLVEAMPESLRGIRIFEMEPGVWMSARLVEFVRERLL